MTNVGVDVGGTFTDLVFVAGGRLWTRKVLSTPLDPARGVLEGLAD
jgi:N-methylhydantoinase A